MTVQGVIYYFQHLPFNLAGGEQDFQEQREGLPLIVNMLEPWMVAGGFQAPLLIPTDGRTRESFFPLTPCPDEQQWRACHGFIKYSLTATTHTQRHDTKEAQYNFQCADI